MTNIIGLAQVKSGAVWSTVWRIPREGIDKRNWMNTIKQDCEAADIISKQRKQEVK